MRTSGKALLPIVTVAGVIAGGVWLVNVLRAGPPAPPPRASVANAIGADWIKRLSARAAPLTEPGPLVAAAAPSVARAAKRSAIPESDLNAAMAHAADWVYHRYVQADYAEFVSFLRTGGYELFDLAEWAKDRMTAEQLAGLSAHGPAPATSEEAFKRLWDRAVVGKPKVLSFSHDPEAIAFAAKRLARTVKGIPADSPLREQPEAYGEGGDASTRWHGSGSGTSWPVWHPSPAATARIREAGAPMVELAIVLTLDSGVTQPLWLVLGQDQTTKKWYVLLTGTYHDVKSGGFYGGGF